MILTGLILAAIALTAFVAVVAGIQATERRKSFHDPSRDGWAGRFARRVLGVRACQIPPVRDRERGSATRKRVRA